MRAFLSRLPFPKSACKNPNTPPAAQSAEAESADFAPFYLNLAGAHAFAASLPCYDLSSHVGLIPVICGVGPVAAALALGRCLGMSAGPGAPAQDITGLIIAGLAGSYDPVAAPVGSLVIASEECLPEYGIWPDAGEALKNSPFPPGEPEAMSLPQVHVGADPVFHRLDMAPDKALGRMGLSCHSDSRKNAPRRGVSLTVAGVSGTPGRARRLASLFHGLTENMEGFSLALGAMQANLPCLEIRAVSNEAGFRPPHTWDMGAAMQALGEAGHMLFAPFLNTQGQNDF